MCSVDTEHEELIFQSEEIENLRLNGIPDGQCNKCLNNGHLVYHGKDFICQSCFITYCNHKFRSTIGKAHVVKHGDKVLVGFSGGAASTAMLHMLLQGLSDSSHKRIKFHPTLIFINEFMDVHGEEVKHLIEKMLSSQLPCYFTSLNMYFKKTDDEQLMYQKIDKIEDEINEAFFASELLNEAIAKLPSLSSKEDFIKSIRMRLLSEIGQNLNFDKIFVGDSSSLLAVEMLSGIALGRGSQIPSFVSFADNRYCLPILRPLREFQLREISIYNQYFSLMSMQLPTVFNSAVGSKRSIKKLTETFVTGLQEDFPATVPTIFRTGDKICSNSKETVYEERCSLCLSLIDIENNKFSALNSLLLSQELCKPMQKVDNLEACNCDCSASSCHEKVVNNLKLCYACLCLAQEANDSTFIPPFILETLEKENRRALMKRDIEEFLIKDE